MLFSLMFFYTFFYFFSRYGIAHFSVDSNDREKALNWFAMIPIIFEMFVISWVIIEEFKKNDGEKE